MGTSTGARARQRAAFATGVATVTVALALLVAGCGVPLDDEPRAIDRTTTSQTTVVPPASGDGKTMSIYFFGDERLVDQQVAADNDPTIDDAIKSVLGKPEPPLTTLIPTGTELLGFELDGQTAIIDLSEDIQGFTGPEQKGAYAQLVFTALASGQATSVQFRVNGEAVKAPTDNGNREFVVANDYDPPLNPR